MHMLRSGHFGDPPNFLLQENGVGHHFVKLLKGQTSDSTNVATFKALLHNVTQKSAERLSCSAWIQEGTF